MHPIAGTASATGLAGALMVVATHLLARYGITLSDDEMAAYGTLLTAIAGALIHWTTQRGLLKDATP